MLRLIESIQSLQSLNQENRKNSDSFLQALREWSLAEEIYSKNLNHVSNHFGLRGECFGFIRNYAFSTSARSNQLSEKISSIVIEYFKQLLNSQSTQIKNNFIENQKISEYIQRKCSLVYESMDKYFNSCRKCELIAFELDKESSNPKKEKIFQKLMTSRKETDSLLANYQAAVEKFNQSRDKISRLLQKLVASYNAIEVEVARSLEESLEAVDLFLTEASEQKVVKQGAEKKTIKPFLHDLNEFSVEELPLENYDGSHPLFQTAGRVGLHFSVLETSGVSKGTQIAVEELYKNEIGGIISKAWTGEDLTSEDYIKFNSRIREPLGRKIWSWSMNSRRTQGIFKIPEKGFSKIGELMLAALNECERTEDIQVAKNCIILSQTFYKEQDQPKVFLQSFISDHSIWKKLEFWKKVVDNAIEDELKKGGYDLSGEEAKSHEKHLVFCQLVSFGNIMMSFKLEQNTVLLVESYANRYDFTQVEIKEIMATIHDSLQN